MCRKKSIIAQFPASGSNLEGVINRQPTIVEVKPSTDEIDIIPIRVMHGQLPILGYRVGTFAYITDMKSIDDAEISYLEGVETLVVNALRFEKPHHSHQLVDDAIAFSRRVGAKQTYFTHLTHDIGTHRIANMRLPEGFFFAYDGEVIDV